MWTAQERLRFQIIAAMAALDTGLYCARALTMRWGDLAAPLAIAAALILGAAYFRHQGRRAQLSATLVAVAQIMFFAAFAAVLNYLLLSDRPLIDALLLRMDEALGIRWPELFAALKGGAFGRLLTTVYESSGMQLALLVAYLGLSGRTAELDRFLLAFFLATLTAFAFWTAFPSFGAATYLVSTGAVTDIPGATVGRSFALVLLALKSGALSEMFLQDLKGLVAFPSMHTVMALLTVYAVRDVPWLLWPALAWNGLMLLAIPVDGGHHVVDVAGGAVLTVAAIAAARRISRWVERGGTYPIPAAAAARVLLDALTAQARRALQTR